MSEKSKGMLLMLLSTLSFSSMQIVVSKTSSKIGVMQQVFVRNLISLIIVGIILKRKKISFYGEKKYQPQLFARSFFGFLGVIFLFIAARNAYQADVTIITRTSPFMITILSVIFLKEKITKTQIAALVIAFAGAYIAADPKFDSSFLPMASALLSAFCNGICYTLLAYFKGKVNALTVIMHFSTFSTVAAVPFMIGNFAIPDLHDMLMLSLIGIFAAIGQITMTYSYRMAPASVVSIYSQLGIVFVAILAYVFLGEKPGSSSLIGGMLVITGSLLVYLNNKKTELNVSEG